MDHSGDFLRRLTAAVAYRALLDFKNRPKRLTFREQWEAERFVYGADGQAIIEKLGISRSRIEAVVYGREPGQ